MFLFSCNTDKNKKDEQKVTIDLEQIIKRGKLIALTDFNSTSYFIYRGEPMGYQYDMLKLLADYLSVDLEIIVSNDLEDTFDKLNTGKCDLLALNLTVTKQRNKFLNFVEPYSYTKQVLVQRKPKEWTKMSRNTLEKKLLRNQLDLARKTVYVQKNSAFSKRLKNLSEEIGDSINIIEVENYSTEQLISLVSKGEIDYTVSDENVALLNQTYYPNIDVKTAISFPQKLAWAVRKNSPELLATLNEWVINFKKTARYRIIYNKYYKNKKATHRKSSGYLSSQGGKISDYDAIIRRYSKQIGWDWRLLASLIYQESRFDPKAESWAGAFGLMQLMPRTARKYGANQRSSPTKNIKAGVQFIKWLDKNLKDSIANKQERIKFILASYNVGLGHVQDAMRLAVKNGKNPKKWTDNVDYYILNKSNPVYYQDPVVKYGYCRGSETFAYVTEILERYEHYKLIISN
ncbi:MAG: transporter substrate-binding domain-containing protein [Chlorobi bacterium]|nr:transporter substrate-binding domain-containing protein [Chlorobiota bacterium]